MRIDTIHSVKRRLPWLKVIVLTIASLILIKAFYYQCVKSEWLTEETMRRHQKTPAIQGKRGMILDASGREMALSIDTVSIGIHPQKMLQAQMGAQEAENRRAHKKGIPPQDVRLLDTTITLLAETSGLSPASLRALVESDTRDFLWLRRKLPPIDSVRLMQRIDQELANPENPLKRTIDRQAKHARVPFHRIQKEVLPGVVLVPEYNRYYPNKTMAAQVVGFTGIDGKGMEGIEKRYDADLSGYQTSVKVFNDANGEKLDIEMPNESEYNGNHVVLTIDGMIQHSAEKALEEAVTTFEAKSGMALVMNPYSGAILALAHYPFYNPNNMTTEDKHLVRVRAATDPFEPGSTMKIFSAAAAIEYNVCKPETVFFCENGAYRIGTNVVHDTHSYGNLTLTEIIKYSSNIGAIKVGQLVGPDALFLNLKNFGFGDRTGIDLSSESAGMLSDHRKWRKIDAGTIAFGQGVAVTVMQMAAATAALANGGLLVKPHLVRAVLGPDGHRIKEFPPEVIRRACSARTAQVVRDMMKEVVATGGTGVNAAMEGYTVCGKTGTAQKTIGGAYARGKYVSSFIGFVPADRPAAVILVIVDEPFKRHYGGTVAAPAFRKIAIDTLGYLGIPPEIFPKKLMVSLDREVDG